MPTTSPVQRRQCLYDQRYLHGGSCVGRRAGARRQSLYKRFLQSGQRVCAHQQPSSCDDANVCDQRSLHTKPCVGHALTNDGNLARPTLAARQWMRYTDNALRRRQRCTINDTCSAGACMGGSPPTVTTQTCTTTATRDGCVHTRNTAPCNDGSALRRYLFSR